MLRMFDGTLPTARVHAVNERAGPLRFSVGLFFQLGRGNLNERGRKIVASAVLSTLLFYGLST